MSSRQLKIKSKSCKHRRKWLMLKVQNLKKHYDEVLSTFKQRLDNIVNPALNAADNLLATENEEHFLNDVYSIGIELEKCSNELFDVELLFCHSDTNSTDDDSDDTTSQKSYHLQIQQGSISSSLRVAEIETSQQVSSVCATSTFLNTDKKKVDNGEEVIEKTKRLSIASKAALCPADDQPLCNYEIDLLMLHSIEVDVKTPVLVSDVVGPNLFSVQPVDCKDQLVQLQKSLNSLYSETWTKQLTLTDKPKEGTICVALFRIDNLWYRAKILKEMPDDKYEVIYIDYGNRNTVTLEDMRMIDPSIGNIPQLSIQCSLFGVQPASKNPVLGWSAVALEWFDHQVFGKRFVAEFTSNTTSPSTPFYSAHLYSDPEETEGNPSSWSVTDLLVHMGFGTFTLPPISQTDDQIKEVYNNEVFDKSPPTSKSNNNNNNKTNHTKQLVDTCANAAPTEDTLVERIPAGMEWWMPARRHSSYRYRVPSAGRNQSPNKSAPSPTDSFNGRSASGCVVRPPTMNSSPRKRHSYPMEEKGNSC